MAFVYHIHLPEQSGEYDKGYIGFTATTVSERFKEHVALAAIAENTYTLHNAIRKHGDALVVTTLVEGSSEYCLDIEYRLRPYPNIGWNIACGGSAPMLGRKHSDATRTKIKAIFTPEHIKKISDRQKAIPTWCRGSSDKAVWATASEIFKCYNANKDVGAVVIGRAFGLSEKKLEAMLKKFKSGWVPDNDEDWKIWSEDKPKLEKIWDDSQGKLQAKAAEITPELRAARSKGASGRVWTEEMKDALILRNKGKRHTEESKLKISKSKIGKKHTEEQIQARKDRLAKQPWTNAAKPYFWTKAEDIRQFLLAGKTQADILRFFGLDRKSGSLAVIIKKIKFGWNPSEDEDWISFKENYAKES
jgi:hypothetical protein